MHHYNFPPFSVGEARPVRAPGRREIGHGALGERALLPVIPKEADFPYTIRLVSEVLESNGSSSQASICGSTLALMDAGVPIKAPVAGIAMGLIMEGEHYTVLTDIQGLEDHLGDMDFKVAGTKDGITALQMDIKIAGITREILEEALEQARSGRLHILNHMLETLERTASAVVEVCTENCDDDDQSGQDPRCDWTGREDDQQHHRPNGRQNRYRARRDGLHRVDRPRWHRYGDGPHRRHRP